MSRAAQQWKQKAALQAIAEAVDLDLPSGVTIRARRPDPTQLAMWGRLPMGLAAEARGEAEAEMSSDDVVELVRLMREVLIYCCVEPRISLAPQGPDELHPREIPDEDLKYIIRWATRADEVRAYKGFRGEPADARPGGDREGIRPAAVGAAGDRRSGAGAQF
jgi:hypothetical protein